MKVVRRDFAKPYNLSALHVNWVKAVLCRMSLRLSPPFSEVHILPLTLGYWFAICFRQPRSDTEVGEIVVVGKVISLNPFLVMNNTNTDSGVIRELSLEE